VNVEHADTIKDVIAFITARWKDDEDAAKALLGWMDGREPTEAEMEVLADNVLGLLMGMTDFAISQLQLMGMIAGVGMEKMMTTIGIQMAKMVD
jgi:hypothetical protein